MLLLFWWYQLMFDRKCRLAASEEARLLKNMADVIARRLFAHIDSLAHTALAPTIYL